MVDWERVERLRSKGSDWADISSDPKVNFTPPEGVDDTGRALKTLYYSRKSTRSRSGGNKASVPPERSSEKFRRFLMPGGLAIAILGAIWFPFAFETSLVGFLVPAFPYVLFVIMMGVIFLAASFVLGTGHLSEMWKKPVAVGIILGLLIPGALALTDSGLGVPNLSGNTFGEPGGWESETPRNAVWMSNGLPVFFYYGSIACPYCSASSWAIWGALNVYTGTMSGAVTGTSNPNEVGLANIPEMEFQGASESSSYVSLDAKEGTDVYSTQALPPLSTVEQAYVTTYGSNGIPFVVIGGMFIHVGTMVSPSILQGLQPSDVQRIMANPSSNPTVYNAIHGQELYLWAYIFKSDQIAGLPTPTFGSDNSNVLSIVAAIK